MSGEGGVVAGSDGGGEIPYPEYERLRDQARLSVPRFTSPDLIADYESVIVRRGRDWCTAVLARPFPGLRSVTSVEAHMLSLADSEDLNPPLPQSVARAREAGARHAADLRDRQHALEARDQERWAAAVALSRVAVLAQANVTGRRTGTGLTSGPLVHAVPVSDAASGPLARPRLHAAGRAVCERFTRARPRVLAAPDDRPVTCKSCLALVPQLRPAE